MVTQVNLSGLPVVHSIAELKAIPSTGANEPLSLELRLLMGDIGYEIGLMISVATVSGR